MLYDFPLNNDGAGNTVYSNSATAPPAGNPPSFNEVAAGFQAPATGSAILDDIKLLVFNWGSPAVVSVSLVDSKMNDDGSIGSSALEPDSGTVLETWTTSVPTTPWAPDATFATISVSSQTRPVLRAGSLYWVVLSTTQPGASVAWVTHPVWVPNPGVPTSAWYAERNSSTGFEWAAHVLEPGLGKKMQVKATVWSIGAQL